ncbi:hypothetical protein [Actinomyces faecalis]|uniref:hypothetical protein n=1 Tax=Actinomyces faecalis TaxID=2722820 RepID=UPI0015544D57|nr:hypothetical protein [Actinomyces faecalis]
MPYIPQKQRSITRLHLDLRNPRLGRPSAKDEKEAMERLLDKFGDEILHLARSIADKGLDPLQSWAVVEENGKMVVLEGNRRLVACRLLSNPKKAPTPEWRRRFNKIRDSIETDDDYQRPGCVKFERRADARYWIQIKHHGKGKGEGTAPWGPEMVYLDQVSNGGDPTGWNEFWYWLEETYVDDGEVSDAVQQARREQYTLMNRVYDWKVRELLRAGLNSSGKIEVKADPQKVRPFILELMSGMAGQRSSSSGRTDQPITSRTLNDRESAERVLSGLWDRTVGHADVSASVPSPPAPLAARDSSPASQAPAQPTGGGHGSTQSKPASGPSPQSRQRERPRKSETHLYWGARRGAMPDRVNRLLKECQRLEIAEYPEACAILARAAVEHAVDALIEERALSTKKSQLKDKITVVLRHLDPNLDSKSSSIPALRGTWAAIRTNEESGHLIKDLNDCVHSYQFTAAQDVAKRANQVLSPLITAINDDLSASARGVATGDDQRHS